MLITIPGKPTPKNSGDIVKWGKRRGFKRHPRTERAEAWAAECVRRAFDGVQIEAPVRVEAVFILPRPGRLRPKRHPPGVVWAPKRPDIDNLTKLLLDAMAPVWLDDAQVVDWRAVKVYAERDRPPRTVVRVTPAGDVPAWARDMADASLCEIEGG